jgi:hypothetical protein
MTGMNTVVPFTKSFQINWDLYDHYDYCYVLYQGDEPVAVLSCGYESGPGDGCDTMNLRAGSAAMNSTGCVDPGGGGGGGDSSDPTPSCDPRLDPDCEAPMDSAQIALSLEALAQHVNLNAVPDSLASVRSVCSQALNSITTLLTASPTQVYVGMSEIEDQGEEHDAGFFNGVLHVDIAYLDQVTSGIKPLYDLANTLLHEGLHSIGYIEHEDPWDGIPAGAWGYQYETEPFRYLNHPNYNSQGFSCIDYGD